MNIYIISWIKLFFFQCRTQWQPNRVLRLIPWTLTVSNVVENIKKTIQCNKYFGLDQLFFLNLNQYLWCHWSLSICNNNNLFSSIQLHLQRLVELRLLKLQLVNTFWAKTTGRQKNRDSSNQTKTGLTSFEQLSKKVTTGWIVDQSQTFIVQAFVDQRKNLSKWLCEGQYRPVCQFISWPYKKSC